MRVKILLSWFRSSEPDVGKLAIAVAKAVTGKTEPLVPDGALMLGGEQVGMVACMHYFIVAVGDTGRDI